VQAAVTVDVVVPVSMSIPTYSMIGNVCVVYVVTGFGILYLVNVFVVQGAVVVIGCKSVESVLVVVVTTAVWS
jgi:hypothetical protein